MNRYLLDTDSCIYYLNATSKELVNRILAAGPSRLSLSTLTLAELHFGAARSGRPSANAKRVDLFADELTLVPFSEKCAREFGRIKADLRVRGTPIGDIDIAIAASAVVTGHTIVSADRDFRRIHGLEVENWRK